MPQVISERPPVSRSHPARFAAWRKYCDEACAMWTPRDSEVAKAAFIAGWEARKKAQYTGEAS